MSDPLAGACRGCQATFDRLDVALAASVNMEVEITGADARPAKLHALAAVASWWLDRTVTQFKERDRGLEASIVCLERVFEEQGSDTFGRSRLT